MIAYPMYDRAHHDGDRLDEFKVYAVLKDETKLPIDRDNLGMSWWIFRRNVVKPVLSNQVERLTAIIDRFCKQSQGTLARLEVSDTGLAISAQGLVNGLKPQVVGGVAVTCEGR